MSSKELFKEIHKKLWLSEYNTAKYWASLSEEELQDALRELCNYIVDIMLSNPEMEQADQLDLYSRFLQHSMLMIYLRGKCQGYVDCGIPALQIPTPYQIQYVKECFNLGKFALSKRKNIRKEIHDYYVSSRKRTKIRSVRKFNDAFDRKMSSDPEYMEYWNSLTKVAKRKICSLPPEAKEIINAPVMRINGQPIK